VDGIGGEPDLGRALGAEDLAPPLGEVVSGGRVGALDGLVHESEVGAALSLLDGGGGVDAEGLDLLGDMEHGAWLDAEGSGVRPHLA